MPLSACSLSPEAALAAPSLLLRGPSPCSPPPPLTAPAPPRQTFIIFGEAKIEDLSAQAQTAAAEQFKAPEVPKPELANKADKPTIEEIDDGGEVDESGVEPKDVELVMSQAGVSRSKAVKALKTNDGDIVNAIMELTM